MNRKIIYTILILLLGVTVTTSCRDDFFYENGVIGEGNANITATVSFHPLISALDEKSRAAGDAIKDINKIQIVIYTAKGEFFRSQTFSKEDNNLNIIDSSSEEANTDMPDTYKGQNQAEERTAKASFELKNIPFGRYYMYVVANYDGILDENNVDTPDKLKAIKVKWQEKPEDLSKNAQMFGCLATDDQKDHDDQAPLLTINRKSLQLHAWIKRLASKLTLVFDGSGLHEGIFVYIYKATIHDIPSECQFGSGNKASDKTLIGDGESLYYHKDGSVTSEGKVVEWKDLDFNFADNNCLEIDKATVDGAIVRDENGNALLDEDGKVIPHPERAEALYFYENCQGDFEGDEEKNKQQIWEEVGENITKPEQADYKDNVPNGTYVEVEGYYTANYNGYLSNGPIKYRFMLGQNTTYNYDALRNRHYKLTLGFKGYANQPDWHIEYYDQEPGLYPPEQFFVSYLYNVRNEMPIRLTGDPTEVTMQIVENNWAPYDPSETQQPYFVPNGDSNPTDPMAFKWNRQVYENTTFPQNWQDARNYHYGLHAFTSRESSPYQDNIIDGAPEWVRKDITPIWVGFLALQAPTGYEDYNTPLPTGIRNIRINNNGDFYDNPTTIAQLKAYYYGEDTGESGRPANTIPLYENTYKIEKSKLSDTPTTCLSGKNSDRNGRNSFTAVKNIDGSVTINVPMFTQPKDLGYISGFSGNNPYEAYYRKAVVKITAYYNDHTPIVKYVPVLQMRRIINPKAVWRTWDDDASFEVKLMVLDSPNATTFTHLESEGEWEAWVADPLNESQPLTSGTFTLDKAVDGKVKGVTGSKIAFKIKFANDVNHNETKCGKIIVRYHGLTCEHSIYVRKGYNVPVKVGSGANDKKWSSYAVFAFNKDAPKPTYTYNGNTYTWTLPPSTSINGLKATLTVNPLALGTLFKRGNYNEGIRIINNKIYKPLEAITGPLTLTSGSDSGILPVPLTAIWNSIYGIPHLPGLSAYKYGTYWQESNTMTNNSWKWSNFVAQVPEEHNSTTYEYDFPTLEDYTALMVQGFGVGVMYADGATETASTTEAAFGFFNEDNTVDEDPRGMRGIIVYNLKDYSQIFFPIGYSGIGRRTLQNAVEDDWGILRYGAQAKVLSVENNPNNQYRPICYNNPAYPGAIYWAKGNDGTGNAVQDIHYAMDMNFFDLSFGPYDNAANFPDFGDALPIKPVVIREINPTATNKSHKKKTR